MKIAFVGCLMIQVSPEVGDKMNVGSPAAKMAYTFQRKVQCSLFIVKLWTPHSNEDLACATDRHCGEFGRARKMKFGAMELEV